MASFVMPGLLKAFAGAVRGGSAPGAESKRVELLGASVAAWHFFFAKKRFLFWLPFDLALFCTFCHANRIIRIRKFKRLLFSVFAIVFDPGVFRKKTIHDTGP
jgi:hypothetical protein